MFNRTIIQNQARRQQTFCIQWLRNFPWLYNEHQKTTTCHVIILTQNIWLSNAIKQTSTTLEMTAYTVSIEKIKVEFCDIMHRVGWMPPPWRQPSCLPHTDQALVRHSYSLYRTSGWNKNKIWTVVMEKLKVKFHLFTFWVLSVIRIQSCDVNLGDTTVHKWQTSVPKFIRMLPATYTDFTWWRHNKYTDR